MSAENKTFRDQTEERPTQRHEAEMKIVNEQILPFGCSDVYEVLTAKR
jgi:hypothetical protein